jgi:hypothetical protein
MTSGKNKSVPYRAGYGKPPLHKQFRKGQSGNPGGRPRRAASERAKALALREAYRTVTVKERGRVLALPAIQAILRSQIALAAKGNVQAQRAVLEAIQTIEHENVFESKLAAAADAQLQYATVAGIQTENAGKSMSYTEAARRVRSLLRLDEEEPESEPDKSAAGAAQSGNGGVRGAAPRASNV